MTLGWILPDVHASEGRRGQVRQFTAPDRTITSASLASPMGRVVRLVRARLQREVAVKPRLVTRHAFSFAFVSLVVAAAVACSSSTTPTAIGPAGLTCASPGEATVGPADTHCMGQPTQEVNASSCFVTDAGAVSTDMDASVNGATEDAGSGDDAGAADDCPYGATMFGGTDGGGAAAGEGDDDDCKYHLSWTSTPICQSATLGVTFTVTVTNLTTGQPVTDIPASEGILAEAFIPISLTAACDNMSNHISPTMFAPGSGLLQTSPTSGVYVGSIIFDQPGEWTVRFHIHEECDDVLDDSPHGHAAFHINVP